MFRLRVRQVAQLRGLGQIGRRAVPDFSALRVLCAWWEGPFQLDTEDQRSGSQRGDSRWQAGLALQVRQQRRDRQRRDVQGADSAHPGHVLAGVDSGHINRLLARAWHLDPLTRAPAPFHVIRNRAWRSIPTDGHVGDGDTLLNHNVLGHEHRARRSLHAHRYAADGPDINHGTEVDGVKLARLVLDALELVLVPFRARDVAHQKLHGFQVVVFENPAAFGFRHLAKAGREGDATPIQRADHTRLGLAAGQVHAQLGTGRKIDVTVNGNHPPCHRADTPAIRAAGQHRVGHGDDLPGLRNAAVQAHTEGRGPCLRLLGDQRVLASALRLPE
ncbi:Fibronectin [Pseudomonas syringae pv. maculicola]|nr:Fibronectin [Pseudomonas syringae pv. maculicola]